MKRLGWVLLLAGCATSAGDPKTAAPTSETPRGPAAALAKLPPCQAGAEVGRLAVRAAMCTKKFCQEACCNQCSWAATFEDKSGQPVPAPQERVQALLGLPQSALDCEIADWNQALSGQSVSLEGPGCVVR